MMTRPFKRKNPLVEAILVSDANLSEIAEWCKGSVWKPFERTFGICFRINGDSLDIVYVRFGEWLVKDAEGVFHKYDNESFEKLFEEMTNE